MNEAEKAAFDAVQAEKASLGIPNDPATMPVEVKEEPKPEVTEEKPKEEEVVVEPEKEVEDDEESDEETDDDESEVTRPKRISISEHKEMKAKLRDEIKTLKDKLASKDTPVEEKLDMESEIEKLSKTLNFDKEKTKAIIETARKGLDKKVEALSPEDKAELETLKAKNFMAEQESIFNGEWGQVLPSLKAQYPNATEEQIQLAKAEMDKLSHSKDHNQHELDYILFKNKDTFGKILFSPKQKTFESGRPSALEVEETPLEFRPDMTPAQFAAYEKQREARIGSESEKVTVRTTDDAGNVIDREM